MKLINKAILVGLLLGSSAQFANATGTTWDFTDKSSNTDFTSTDGNYSFHDNTIDRGNVFKLSKDGVNLEIRAFANTGSGGTIEEANVSHADLGLLNYNANYNPETNSGDSHAIDNKGGQVFDMLYFEFSEMVSITNINLGWKGDDSDIAVAAFNDISWFSSLDDTTWGDVAHNAAWKGTFFNLTNYDLTSNINNVEAKYWLIGAYNQVFDGASWTEDNDSVKIASLTTHKAVPEDPNTTPVDAPSTIAMMSLALGGLLVRRRKAMK
ncbi:exosortase-dependent surface protein XDP1 [Alteromonas lipolytica]|uniref:PEP-CTERM protein-sorting domain-containing protein n=1 Tax=Alteromonas lipolytica TaxID=1856405 RepID=A0A1E8F977_9ALTE|nr:exosortase-dependent surface protein XDP1 [Alteromonas lipolytica]OFI32472.1 hypothetical protein BFC17_04720 [Alteromonas lipolytica]GGF75875.1 hypothetical protein GCM10011338_29980 [Alteromonas lipolytica]